MADERACREALALGDVLVVLPGARAGRRLTELLIDEADARELALTPPRMTTVGSLPEVLYRPRRPLADEALSRRIWTRALRALPARRRSVVFPHPPADGDLHGWTGLARLVHRLHREIAGRGLDFADVASRCGEGEGYDDGDRWRVLADAQADYHRRLGELGRIDRDAARRGALEEGDVGLEGEAWLVGVVEMPDVTKAMLGTCGDGVVALVHAPEARAEAFDELGCVRTDAWSGAEIEVPEDAIRVCGRPPSQADEAVRRLGGEGRSLAPDEISVGVPDDELVPFLEQRFEAYGIPHRYAAGTPLSATNPYRLLDAVADVLEGRRFRDVAALLRHPDVEGRVGGPGALEAADWHFQEHLPARLGSPDAGEGPDGGGRFGRVLRSLDEELALGRLRGRRPLGEWMPEILSLLQRAYGERAPDRGRPEDRRLVEACGSVREAAAALHRLPDAADEPCSGATAIRCLLAELREEAVPPSAETSAVEMLGWLELHLDDAPVLVLTGFTEDQVPASVNADLFLPNALRRRLGLVDNDRRYARDAYLLSAILASREEVHVLVGRRDAEGDPLRPSRLLLATSGPGLARRAERLFDDEPDTAGPLPRLGVEAGEASRFRTPPEPELRIPDPPEVLRVTDFRLLLQDPYRFVLERLLGLEEQDDRGRELDAPAFGSLAHEVLHRFGESPEVHSADPDAARERLEGLLGRVAGQRYGSNTLPAVRIQVEQLRLRLRDFASWHAARVQDGWETVAVEVETPEEGVPFDVDGQPVRLRGRIDRIDRRRATGEWQVLDYKTSGASRDPDGSHRRGGEWVDLQLPLYRHLVGAMAEAGRLPGDVAAGGAAVALGYVNLSREGVGQAMADWGDDVLASADTAARDAVRLLRSGVVKYRGDGVRYRDDPLASLLGERRMTGRKGADDGADGGAPDG